MLIEVKQSFDVPPSTHSEWMDPQWEFEGMMGSKAI